MLSMMIFRSESIKKPDFVLLNDVGLLSLDEFTQI